MLEIGDKVKLNIQELERVHWTALHPKENISKKDYKNYILEDVNRIYIIASIDKIYKDCPYILDDEFMKETSFAYEELFKQ